MFKIIRYLLWIGAMRRYKFDKPFVIVVCGSVGKTTTKEAIADVLAVSGRTVIKTPGNLGTDVGVPLALIGCHEQPFTKWQWFVPTIRSIFYIPKPVKNPIYVLEYSSDKPGDIEFLAKKIAPDIAVITKIAPVHQQFFPIYQSFLDEELAIVKFFKPNGVAVLNADDKDQAGVKHNNIKWYGIDNKCQYQAHNLKLEELGWSFEIDNILPKAKTQILGKHQLYSLIAAAVVGKILEVGGENIQSALEKFQLPPGRGRVIEGLKSTTIIDDSYNSSPEAVKSGLQMIGQLYNKRRRVAILGRMNELGDKTSMAQKTIGASALGNIDFLILVGDHAEVAAQSAIESGFDKNNIATFDKPLELLTKISDLINEGDVIYVKASQNGMMLERVVKKLMLHPEHAQQLLVRQEKYWLK